MASELNLDFLSVSVDLVFPLSNGPITVGSLRDFVQLLNDLGLQDDHLIDDAIIYIDYKPKREFIRCGECHQEDVLLLTHECKGYVFPTDETMALKSKVIAMQEELDAMRAYCKDIREAALLVGGVDHTTEAANIIIELGRQRDARLEPQPACPMCGSAQVHYTPGDHFAGCMECKEMWRVK